LKEVVREDVEDLRDSLSGAKNMFLMRFYFLSLHREIVGFATHEEEFGGPEGILDGVTLSDKIRESGHVPWRDGQAIMIEICTGLQAIHQVGIIHGDLKSRNVMLAERNGAICAVLTDFGLACEFKSPSSETMSYVTRPGVIAGTPAYMAPEQFEGTELSPATDICALGVVLYELVTGKHPFAASTAVGAAVLRGRLQLMAETNVNYVTKNEFRLVAFGLAALIVIGAWAILGRKVVPNVPHVTPATRSTPIVVRGGAMTAFEVPRVHP
jgi:serine/threonine protein kinase